MARTSQSQEIPLSIHVDVANCYSLVRMGAWRASRLKHPARFWTVYRQVLMKLHRKSWPRLVRGLLSLSVLLGVCAMLLPLPIAPPPSTSSEKDSSEPFPCQNRPCGCMTAEQCWKKCCCFDNTQKIAWAKANNVKVPDNVLAAAKKERRKTTSQTSKSISCCKHREKKAVTATNTSCCEKAIGSKDRISVAVKSGACDSCSSSARKLPDVQKKPSKSKWVLAIYAAECQGQGPPVFCFPTSILPERVDLVEPSVVVIEILTFESERLQPASLRPPLPPPKIV